MKEELIKKEVTLRKPWFPSNKKGSHVGLILSFAIFIIFIAFMYPLVGPALELKEDKQIVLSSLEKSLFEQFSSDIVTITLDMGNTIGVGTSCIQIQDDFFSGIGENIIIKDEIGSIHEYSKSDDIIYIDTTGSELAFLKMQASDELTSSYQTSLESCVLVADIDTKFELITTKNWILESKIIEMFGFYEAGYELLKVDILGVPAENDFWFKFEYSNGTIISTEEREIYTSIYTSENSIPYIDLDGNISSGLITIIVW